MPLNAVFYRSYADAQKIPSDPRPQIAFTGRSNVGKSSLLNRLVAVKRLAKTSKTPGRTRLVNFFLINEKYFFVDLPGYGYAKASENEKRQWGKLVNNYLESSPMLRAVCFLLDCRRDPNEDDLMMVDWLQSRNLDFAIVLTKADKLTRNNLAKKSKEIEKVFKVTPIPFSSVSGVGKRELIKWIEDVVGNPK
ncbi:MAG: YihA family ribosome biogenesis GTP-binding protein [candidate division Zixibacteria bacterium HGW-Zixibacteria-1]|nr:MAG: YihA family ribosome biogenesis GTP-binding protein [candidate division Zixibacteria bacterium HGW-Zixibacteria-1]